MLFLWLEQLRLNQIIRFKQQKKIVCPQNSLDRLKNTGKPRIGVSPPTVYVSSTNVKSERKYIEKHLFYGFASL